MRTGTADYYRSQYAKRRPKVLTEDTVADLTSLVRGAVHHYGEELRLKKDLPDDSPEKLKLENLFQVFSLAREKIGNHPDKHVVDDLLHQLAKADTSEFLSGIVSHLDAISDAIPIEEPEPEIPDATIPVPTAEDGAPDFGVTEGAPEGEGAESDAPKEGEPQDEGDDGGEISDEDFKDLVSQLSQ